MLGKGLAAAEPDCCRYVEQLCVKLVLIHSSPAKKMPNVHRDYEYIRETVMTNAVVKEKCNLNIPPQNSHTMSLW